MYNFCRIFTYSLFCLCLLAGLEFFLRARGYAAHPTNLANYAFDAQLGWVPLPSHKSYRSTWAYGHFTFADAGGEPQAENGKPAPVTEPETVFLGDSFVEGFYLPYEQSFAFQLSRMLGVVGHNYGVAGYSPEQYLLTARRKLPGRKLARVLTFLYAYNDLPYVDEPLLYGQYPKPIFGSDLRAPRNTPLVDPGSPERDRVFPALLSISLPWLGAILQKEAPPLPPGALETASLDPAKMDRTLAILGRISREFSSPCAAIVYVPAFAEFAELDRNRDLFLDSCRRGGFRCLWPQAFTRHKDWAELYQARDSQRHFSREGSRMFAESVFAELEAIPACLDRSNGPKAE